MANLDQRIEAMYQRDRLGACLLVLFLWLATLTVLFLSWPHVPDGQVRIALAVGAAAVLIFNTSAIVAMLRTIGLAALGGTVLDARAGATHFDFSQPHPFQGVVGQPLAVGLTINAAPSRPNRFFLNDPLPPGLTTIPAADGNRIASGTPVIVVVEREIRSRG